MIITIECSNCGADISWSKDYKEPDVILCNSCHEALDQLHNPHYEYILCLYKGETPMTFSSRKELENYVNQYGLEAGDTIFRSTAKGIVKANWKFKVSLD